MTEVTIYKSHKRTRETKQLAPLGGLFLACVLFKERRIKMDDIDRYTQLEHDMVERQLREVRNSVTESGMLMGVEFCEDCDAEIPMARRKAIPSTIRCVSCQEEYEGV